MDIPLQQPRIKIIILTAIAIGISLVVLSFDRIPQDPNYHRFADIGTIAGIPNFWNLTSNLPFLLVGLYAFYRLPKLAQAEARLAYAVLALGLFLVSFGSAYYHYAPSNQTLVWDRLPMTIAFMALFSMVLGERVLPRQNNTVLGVLVACGIASVVYWSWTEANGVGDLRPYALIQFLPLVLLPLIFFMFAPKYLNNKLLVITIAWYVLAKALEHFDYPVQSLAGVIGGHPLKHLAAAMAALSIVLAVPTQNVKETAINPSS